MVTNSRRDAILQHVGRYGLTLRPVLDKLFYGDAEEGCERDLAELRKQGLLTVEENAVRDSVNVRKGYSYYYLTRKATTKLAVSDARAKAPGPAAIARNLAMLWYCCMRQSRSHKLESSEVADLLRGPMSKESPDSKTILPKGYHCLSQIDNYRLLNTYCAKTTIAEILSELRKRVDIAQRIPAVRGAMYSRQYAFLVLVESANLRDELWKQLREVAKRRKVKFMVVVSPGPWRR